MSCNNYEELKKHLGHNISIVEYGKENVAIECNDCSEVLFDFDKGGNNGKH